MILEPQSPLVSVVIPTFNSAQYLPATLNSVLSQTYSDVEVIIIDDGSKDNTSEVVKPYLDRIQYHRQHNFGGPSGPRNFGIAHSKGDYVAIFDSDDIMHPQKISKEMAAFDQFPDTVLVFSDFSVIDETGICIKESFLSSYSTFRDTFKPGDQPGLYQAQGVELFHALLRSNFIGTSSVIVKKNAILEAGGFDESLLNADDIDLWNRLARDGKTFSFVDKPLHSYRKHSYSISRRGAQRYPNMLIMLNKQLPHILDQDMIDFTKEKIYRISIGYGIALLAEKKYRTAKSIYQKTFSRRKSWAALKGLVLASTLALFNKDKA